MGRIHLETFIAAPIARVFDLARDLDFHQRSLAHTGEQVVGGRLSGLIGLGEEVEWEARHLGMRRRLRSRITEMDPPHVFTDIQSRGPFKAFEHRHLFTAVEGGTLMVDQWQHEAPLGTLGRLADRLFLDRYMRALLEERNRALRAEAESASGA